MAFSSPQPVLSEDSGRTFFFGFFLPLPPLGTIADPNLTSYCHLQVKLIGSSPARSLLASFSVRSPLFPIHFFPHYFQFKRMGMGRGQGQGQGEGCNFIYYCKLSLLNSDNANQQIFNVYSSRYMKSPDYLTSSVNAPLLSQ